MILNQSYEKNKEKCGYLFDSFIKNKNVKFPEFIDKISEDMGKKYTIDDLKECIDYIKRNHSTTKAQLMKEILDSSFSDDKTVEIDMNSNLFSIPFNFKGRDVNQSTIDNLFKKMDIVLNSDKSISDLVEEGKLDEKLLFSRVKLYMKYIDNEKYIKFLIKGYNVNSTSLTELNQAIETIDDLIKNLEDRLYKLNFYDPNTDEDKIRNFHVFNEENLDEYVTGNISRLYHWKVQKLGQLIEKYKNLRETFNIILENKNIKTFKKIPANEQKLIKADAEFLYKYYKNLFEIKRLYDRGIASLNNIRDSRKKELEDEFNKKLILGNNE